MLVNKAYRYELKPNKRQLILLKKHAGCARFAWNWGLAERKRIWEEEERSTNAIELHCKLEYKTKWYGSRLAVVPRFFPSSRRCSECGYVLPELKLSTRRWVCPECGAVHDRDINGA